VALLSGVLSGCACAESCLATGSEQPQVLQSVRTAVSAAGRTVAECGAVFQMPLSCGLTCCALAIHEAAHVAGIFAYWVTVQRCELVAVAVSSVSATVSVAHD
jgi:hypothetical protein